MNTQKEFGDYQTPDDLAVQVVDVVAGLFGVPDCVVEPTAGLGAFLIASRGEWGRACRYEGYEINDAYVHSANRRLSDLGIRLSQQDFFSADWHRMLRKEKLHRILVLGNPPWITNSEQGMLDGNNLPKKANFQRLRGFDAKTGKSNFDVAEWMLIRLIEALPESGAIAMLCKTMTARKVLRHFWKTEGGLESSKLFGIDAKKHFDVAVDACLLFASGKRTEDRVAAVYSSLNVDSRVTEFGLVDGSLVSDVETYTTFRELGGGSPYTWRSGIKHDASRVMEFSRWNGRFVNGLGDAVELEEEFLYPLLKSSDLGNRRTTPRKVVLVTQRRIGDDTGRIRDVAPKTWKYLEDHSDELDSRKAQSIRIVRDSVCSESATILLHRGRLRYQGSINLSRLSLFPLTTIVPSWLTIRAIRYPACARKKLGYSVTFSMQTRHNVSSGHLYSRTPSVQSRLTSCADCLSSTLRR